MKRRVVYSNELKYRVRRTSAMMLVAIPFWLFYIRFWIWLCLTLKVG